MASETREVRLRQREAVEKRLAERLASLSARGLDQKTIDRDPSVRELKADVRTSKKRLAALDAREALVKELAERKAAKAAAPKQPKQKGAKKAAEAAAGGEGKKKKEKKPKKEAPEEEKGEE